MLRIEKMALSKHLEIKYTHKNLKRRNDSDKKKQIQENMTDKKRKMHEKGLRQKHTQKRRQGKNTKF